MYHEPLATAPSAGQTGRHRCEGTNLIVCQPQPSHRWSAPREQHPLPPVLPWQSAHPGPCPAANESGHGALQAALAILHSIAATFSALCCLHGIRLWLVSGTHCFAGTLAQSRPVSRTLSSLAGWALKAFERDDVASAIDRVARGKRQLCNA
jgi:hypothetical protein